MLLPFKQKDKYIIGAALVWALVLRIVWFILPVERPVPVVGGVLSFRYFPKAVLTYDKDDAGKVRINPDWTTAEFELAMVCIPDGVTP